MNQEPNNLNQNDSNLQSSNVFNSNLLNEVNTTNNEPFNNQTNQTLNNGFINNPSVNATPNQNVNVTTGAYVNNSFVGNTSNQNMGVSPTPEPMGSPVPPQPNIFNSSNLNNNNGDNSNLSKKKNSVVIIVIVVILVLILAVLGAKFLLNKTPLNNEDNNSNNSSSNSQNNSNNSDKNGKIKQISFGSDSVTALMDNGDLYYIGNGSLSDYIYDDNEKHQTKKIASNVEKFFLSDALYYINNKKELYYVGPSYNGGASSEFKKDQDNIANIVTYGNLCAFTINDKNELYVKSISSSFFCGLNKQYSEFTKMADNVKSAFVGMNYGGYISNNNELYFSESNSEFNKILDNVKSISCLYYKAILILTNDNKLYIYSAADGEDYILTLLREDVTILNGIYFKTTNGDYNVYETKSDLVFIKDEVKTLYSRGSSVVYYGTLNVKDFSDILFYANYEYLGGGIQKVLVYLSNNGKLVVLEDNNKKELDYNLNNLEKIYELIKAIE